MNSTMYALGRTLGAEVGAGGGLVAGEVASGAEGFLVKPVAVGVETILGEVFVPGDIIFGA